MKTRLSWSLVLKMTRVLLFLGLLSSVYCSIDYDAEQIKELLALNLKCLKSYGVLNDNATFQATLAYAYSVLEPTAPNARPDFLQAAKDFQEGLLPLLEASYATLPNNILTNLQPLGYLNSRADLKYGSSMSIKLPPYKGNFETIDLESRITDSAYECYHKVLKNECSDVLRHCTLDPTCQHEMTLEGFTGEFSPLLKAYYFGFVMATNCSNYSPVEYRKRVDRQCAYLKPVVEYMLKNKRKQEFFDKFHYFLIYNAICIRWSGNYFLKKEIITTIISKIDCNGCVGVDKYTPDVAQILTADTAMILANLLRYTAEMEINKRLIG